MSTENYNTLEFNRVDQIGHLTINRPKKLNALNQEVLQELKSFLEALSQEGTTGDIKGLIVTGSGEKAFIAGADIAQMSDMGTSAAKEFGLLGQQVTLAFENLPIPVIAAVNGFALGGGLEMAMSADFIYATENAIFGQPEVKLGLIPGFGGTQRLARLIGRNRAKEIIYSGRNIKAQEAIEMGLVLKIFPCKESMITEASATINSIAKNSPKAISLAKQVMNEGNDLTIEKGLDCELNKFSAIFSSADMKEGTKAFLEKRTPIFTGN